MWTGVHREYILVESPLYLEVLRPWMKSVRRMKVRRS